MTNASHSGYHDSPNRLFWSKSDEQIKNNNRTKNTACIKKEHPLEITSLKIRTRPTTIQSSRVCTLLN